jgi:hypothetical protein
MAEEQAAPTKEKEEKRKIKVISKIDDLIAIQGQNYMKGQLKEALDLAEQIIELAKTENLASFIKEQEDLIARINGLQKQREEKEREKLRVELNSELKKLEVAYINAFKSEDFKKIKQILENAKNYLIQHDDEEIKERWTKLEKNYLDAKARKDIVEDIKNLIKESSELKKQFLFEDLKLKIAYLMQQIQEKGLNEYLDKIKEIKKDVSIAEETYNQNNKTLDELKEKIAVLRENKEFKKAITDCESIMQLAKAIDKNEVANEYSEILNQLKIDLKHEKLSDYIVKLSIEGLDFLKKGEISDSLKAFEEIRKALKQPV